MEQRHRRTYEFSGAHHGGCVPVIDGVDYDAMTAAARAAVIVNPAASPHARIVLALGHLNLIREVTDIVDDQNGRTAQSALASVLYTLLEQLDEVLGSVEEDLRADALRPDGSEERGSLPRVRLAPGLEGASVRPLDGAPTDAQVLASISQTVGPAKQERAQ